MILDYSIFYIFLTTSLSEPFVLSRLCLKITQEEDNGGGASEIVSEHVVDVSTVTSRIPVLQIHGRGKAFLGEAQGDGKDFLGSECEL